MISSGSIPLQVDRCRSQVGVPELPLDDVERDALAGELVRVRMSQLVRRGLRLTSAFAELRESGRTQAASSH